MLLLCLLAASAVAYAFPTTRLCGLIGLALAVYLQPLWSLALCLAANALLTFTRTYFGRHRHAALRRIAFSTPLNWCSLADLHLLT